MIVEEGSESYGRKKRHRFIGGFSRSGRHLQFEDRDLIHQIQRVLKLRSGEEIILCPGDGQEYLASLTADRRGAELISQHTGWRPSIEVTLYLAMAKRDAFEAGCRQAVECGVSCIVPVISSRTVKTSINRERTVAIIREAAEQCGRPTVPVLESVQPLVTALQELVKPAFIMDQHGASAVNLTKTGQASVLVGPEGGWTAEEVSLAIRAGCRPISLGSLVMRAETAAAVSVWRLQSFL